MKHLLLLIPMLVITACGGGGGGGGSSSGGGSSPSAPSAPSEPTPVPVPAPAPIIAQRSMDELEVPQGFSYQASSGLNLSVQLSSQQNNTAFISVYSEYSQLAQDQYQAVSSSKILSAPMVQGSFSASFETAESTKTLLIEVWQLGAAAPIQKVVVKQAQIDWVE